jgi:hypothetical protein
MEMERKDKNRSVVVDKLIMGTDSPFTRRVADYRLPEKFKKASGYLLSLHQQSN